MNIPPGQIIYNPIVNLPETIKNWKNLYPLNQEKTLAKEIEEFKEKEL